MIEGIRVILSPIRLCFQKYESNYKSAWTGTHLRKNEEGMLALMAEARRALERSVRCLSLNGPYRGLGFQTAKHSPQWLDNLGMVTY